MSNGRAAGPDGIAAELLKYSCTELHQYIADMFHKMFEKEEQLELEWDTLIVLQNSGKPLGELKSLRPIVLLNALHKTLS